MATHYSRWLPPRQTTKVVEDSSNRLVPDNWTSQNPRRSVAARLAAHLAGAVMGGTTGAAAARRTAAGAFGDGTAVVAAAFVSHAFDVAAAAGAAAAVGGDASAAVVSAGGAMPLAAVDLAKCGRDIEMNVGDEHSVPGPLPELGLPLGLQSDREVGAAG